MLEIGSHGNKIRAVLAIVWLCCLVSTASAEQMETSIQEAIYIF